MCSQHEKQEQNRRTFLKASIAGASVLTAVAASPAAVRAAGQQQASAIVEDWPETAKKAAQAMIEKYGEPDGVTKSLLIWHNNGPWKRTIVTKEETDHDFPMPHKDVLEQFINYKVPPEKFDELAQYDGSVIVERTKGEISARCDKEAANFLALNLANDIVNGEKSVEEARQAYGEAIKKMMDGDPPEMTQGFTFEVPQADVGDTDEAIIQRG